MEMEPLAKWESATEQVSFNLRAWNDPGILGQYQNPNPAAAFTVILSISCLSQFPVAVRSAIMSSSWDGSTKTQNP